MLKITIITFLFIAALSCTPNKNKREKFETKDTALSNQDNPTSIITVEDSRKYIYVKLKFLLKMYRKDPDTEELILNKEEYKVYSSQIFEMDNLTEDKKAQIIDSITETINGNHGEIIERKCLIFDSYSTASDDRFKNKDKF